ncbi:hypothetical protein PRZ48_003626 [Zasmidium cellare]|uniref:Uncharacterized protein n=1 Tax=Zasmidium cellare TaxID=395010 RepID=A0ABR0EWU6_ZASCE|nr:hypothetical protein PRZ48_003626 [Zasmidium cellare]
MQPHIIPKIDPRIHTDNLKPTILYNLAKHHTNEEIYIGLIALREPLKSVHTISDVFAQIRDAIRALVLREGRSEDDITEELLKSQREYGVHMRNREQIKEDLFGRTGRSGLSANEQKAVAWRILGEHRGSAGPETVGQQAAPEVKPVVNAQNALSPEEARSIRERMSLDRILN